MLIMDCSRQAACAARRVHVLRVINGRANDFILVGHLHTAP